MMQHHAQQPYQHQHQQQHLHQDDVKLPTMFDGRTYREVTAEDKYLTFAKVINNLIWPVFAVVIIITNAVISYIAIKSMSEGYIWHIHLALVNNCAVFWALASAYKYLLRD